MTNNPYIHFRKRWLDVAEFLDDGDSAAVILSIVRYLLNGTEPNLEGYCAAVFEGLRHDLDKECNFVHSQSTKSRKRRKELTHKQRMMILERDGFTCQYCGRKAPDVALEVDHVIPVSKGGNNKPNNLVTACHECNSGKRAHIIGEERSWS